MKLAQMASGRSKVMDRAGGLEEPQYSDLAEEAKAWLELPSAEASAPEQAAADPLWNSGKLPPQQAPLTPPAATETADDKAGCDVIARRKSFLQGAKIF